MVLPCSVAAPSCCRNRVSACLRLVILCHPEHVHCLLFVFLIVHFTKPVCKLIMQCINLNKTVEGNYPDSSKHPLSCPTDSGLLTGAGGCEVLRRKENALLATSTPAAIAGGMFMQMCGIKLGS